MENMSHSNQRLHRTLRAGEAEYVLRALEQCAGPDQVSKGSEYIRLLARLVRSAVMRIEMISNPERTILIYKQANL